MSRPQDGAASTGPLPTLSRRRLLRLGLIGGGALLGALGGGLAWLRGCPTSIAGLRVLSDAEYRTLSQLADASFPPGGAFPPGAQGMDLARSFDGFLADEPAPVVSDLKMALTLIELGPLAYEGRATTFSRLSREARERHWRTWAVA
ncbi:MAG: hypothetical protein OEY14_15860, partial [Myxococcales bacterium]|nr:hypothetical protein [Myxococcales bacterium]